MIRATCIMPTANRRHFVPAAIQAFLAQDYADRELLIVDDGSDAVADLVPSDPRIRYLREEPGSSLGAKRNLACKRAQGDIILHWDDDDWYASWRVRHQVEALLLGEYDVCGIDRAFFVDPAAERAWVYVHPRNSSRWVFGATLCYRRSFWEGHPFPDVQRGEDTRFVHAAQRARLGVLEDNRFFVSLIHASNTCPKHTNDPRWQACSMGSVRALVGGDWERHFGAACASAKVGKPAASGSALVCAAGGIGDILRVTPLIRVLSRLGYDVDVLLAPDDPAAAGLLAGAPEIRSLLVKPEERVYDVATFTHLSTRLGRWVHAERRYAFDASWRRDGDSACVERIARALGWQGAMPAPFAMKSDRNFALPPNTIAIHPGCKSNWPWKKWHAFDDLAALFPNVVLAGTGADLDNSQTYFARPFVWPEHVRNFIGKLDLRDTAALLSQCAALVSADSGLMHLGVALSVPTFGVFGITSPQRECIPSQFMIPITKELPCEPACRRSPWGRRDCGQHLQCLKELTAQEVLTRVTERLQSLKLVAQGPIMPASVSNETISLNYYGEVFYASGYGQAARAYIHALHNAGVRVHVIDHGRKPRHVEDDLVVSLLGREPAADFNLFHGVPSFWARSAYTMRNVIAMTVWEADHIPPTWRNPLSHAVDVWLPCAFNAEVFARDLERAPFRLPHPLPPRDGAPKELDGPRFGVRPEDFVFYCLFEWQHRKNPRGTIEAFLKAFPEKSDALLFIKTSGRAAREAQLTLDELRAKTQSRGRVTLRCESLDEEFIDALHARGDCYLSLHRGEGWGYPLFEAAAHGTPVVATRYGGPRDYLDPLCHWLVRYDVVPISEPYFLYLPSMRWAEPDLEHASEGLRWIYEHRAAARLAATAAAHRLRSTYSLERVGEAAKARLIELKAGRFKPPPYAVQPPQDAPPASPLAPAALPIAVQPRQDDQCVSPLAPAALPIAGEWYDADYFEGGLKSNWKGGYTWASFGGIFEETAALLHQAFPEATSYVDAGCAKGFLVKALRERGLEGRGFDHSLWAIAHAQASAQDFLELATVDAVAFESHSIDVLVAMSLFEGLTDAQLQRFLTRARKWVREALFATIASPASGDRDLSHITMHDRTWWCDRFVESGWSPHPAQRIIERHKLPKRMRWDIYVLSPEP
jgi:ADP-heptose:LPS heptosyltransferase/glycosyltransferase involved in cell wall biosynthesis